MAVRIHIRVAVHHFVDRRFASAVKAITGIDIPQAIRALRPQFSE